MEMYRVSDKDFEQNFKGKKKFHGFFPANHPLVRNLGVKSGDIVTDKQRSAYSRISNSR